MSTMLPRSQKDSGYKIPPDYEGKMLEIGLIGPTHFFGAIAVLEHGHVNLSPNHLISCSVIDVLTLSRADVGKVSQTHPYLFKVTFSYPFFYLSRYLMKIEKLCLQMHGSRKQYGR